MENATVGAIHESPAPDDVCTAGKAGGASPAPASSEGSANKTVGEGLAPPVPDDRRADGDAPTPASPAFVAEDHAIRAHFDRLWQEAELFAQQVPGFDFAKELEDDGFAQLLSPRRGLTLEQAYFVRHGRALLAAAERAAEQRVTAALQASRRVPAPITGTAAAPGIRWDTADAKAREALKARIRKGEKIYPGR